MLEDFGLMPSMDAEGEVALIQNDYVDSGCPVCGGAMFIVCAECQQPINQCECDDSSPE